MSLISFGALLVPDGEPVFCHPVAMANSVNNRSIAKMGRMRLVGPKGGAPIARSMKKVGAGGWFGKATDWWIMS